MPRTAAQRKTAALVATDTSLSWFEGNCRIGKMYKAKAVYVQAHCGSKDVSVTLDATGDRMRVTWGRKAEDMKRCNRVRTPIGRALSDTPRQRPRCSGTAPSRSIGSAGSLDPVVPHAGGGGRLAAL